ncbi:MAG: ABC transporter permease [Bacteroidales bacterium]
MILFLRLFRESYLFALRAIIANKVRTFLSLLGITIGIFSIISVFTVFDSIETSIRNSIETLGSNVLFVQKWPWSFGGGDYPWWKYMKRPETRFNELEEIQKKSTASDASTYYVGTSRNIKFEGKTLQDATIVAVSHDYNLVMPIELSSGRYFSQNESQGGRAVAVVGSDVANNLIGLNAEPLGKRITVFGIKVEIIGVFKKEGNTIGDSNDNWVMLPVNFGRNYIDLNSENIGSAIVVKARKGVSNDELRDELTGIMRSVRKLKPAAEDNFAINETSIITKGFDSLFSVIAIVGWIIGGFSLLVGGFGIANIMFVSVKERTAIIGIQKSLGAKNSFILFQFLFEAVFLSVLGGITGLLLVYIGTLIVSYGFEMTLDLTTGNIMLGVMVSATIGLVSGIIPSLSASRLNPVDAMRSNG